MVGGVAWKTVIAVCCMKEADWTLEQRKGTRKSKREDVER